MDEAGDRGEATVDRGLPFPDDVGVDDDAWQVGQQVRDWRLTRLLGRGGSGEVFEGWWSSPFDRAPSTPPRVALKFVDMPRARRRRVVDEAKSGMSLRHPNLLPTFDAFEEAGWAVLVMELGDETLRQRVNSAGPLPLAEGWRLMLEVGSGLAAYHATGQRHSDVKPDNILSVAGTWKLADFGISAQVEDGNTHAYGLTNFAYQPPEAGHDHGPAGQARVRQSYDMWAYGLTMHVAVTGRDPRPGDDPAGRG